MKRFELEVDFEVVFAAKTAKECMEWSKRLTEKDLKKAGIFSKKAGRYTYSTKNTTEWHRI